MRIKKLKLNNFRNLNSYELEPSDITLLLGENGVGKTNLIESIHILSVCRSWRTKKDAEVIGWDDGILSPVRREIQRGGSINHHPKPLLGQEGQNTARIEAEILSDSGDIVKPAIAQTGEKKHAFISDKQVPVSTLVGTLPTIIFVPEDMDLPEASPSKRRRNLDMLIAQSDSKYTQNLLKYNQVLKARNKLLNGINKGNNKENELDFWDKEIVELGRKIIALRLEVSKKINELVQQWYKKLADGNGDKRQLTFEYKSSVEDVERFAEELVAVRDQEVRYGNTIIGPHRDDWQLKFDDVDIRLSASRGETRAALLALKMAEMEVLRQSRNEIPILLLDDVFAELDRNHSEAILEFFDGGRSYPLSECNHESKGDGGTDLRRAGKLAQTITSPQIFITATDAEYIPESIKKKAKIIKLKI